MAFTHSIAYTWGDGASTISTTITASADSAFNLDIPCTASGSTAVAIALAHANIRSLYFTADQPLTLTFTLATGSLIVTLAANTPYQWITGNNYTNPFTFDIVSLSVANATTSTGNLKLRFLVNS